MKAASGERAFILSFPSPETGCAAHQLRFFAPAEDVAAVLGHDGRLDHLRFPLDGEDLALLAQQFALALPNGEAVATLDSGHPFDSAPYLIHTNYELPLMLDGRKPFAAFRDIRFDAEPAFGELRDFFRPHVAAGQIIEHLTCREFLSPVMDGGAKAAWDTELFYTLPGEEWRIAAWQALIAGLAGRWRDEDTREEGRLLGYTQAQCDWYIEALRNRRRDLQSRDTSA